MIEPDPTTAARMIGEGIRVVTGNNDSGGTYRRIRASAARMLLANCEDTVNTNITITAREIAHDLPIVAIVEEEDSIDVLQLSGATKVLPLKIQLGEYLANRVDFGGCDAHVIGAYRGFRSRRCRHATRASPARGVRDTRLREKTGVTWSALGARKLRPASPDSMVQPDSVIVVSGTESQDRRSQYSHAGTTRFLPRRADHRGRQGRSAARAPCAARGSRSTRSKERSGARADARRRRSSLSRWSGGTASFSSAPARHRLVGPADDQ